MTNLVNSHAVENRTRNRVNDTDSAFVVRTRASTMRLESSILKALSTGVPDGLFPLSPGRGRGIDPGGLWWRTFTDHTRAEPGRDAATDTGSHSDAEYILRPRSRPRRAVRGEAPRPPRERPQGGHARPRPAGMGRSVVHRQGQRSPARLRL